MTDAVQKIEDATPEEDEVASPEVEEEKIATIEEVNGRKIIFYFPTEVQMVAYFSRVQRISDDNDRISFIMGFIGSLLDSDDETYFWDQIMTRKSGLTIPRILEIMDRVIETVTGKAPSTSSTSTESGGSTKLS